MSVYRKSAFFILPIISFVAVLSLFSFNAYTNKIQQEQSLSEVWQQHVERRERLERQRSSQTSASNVLSRTPQWGNPYLSFLPVEATPDYEYWDAHMAALGQSRMQSRASLRSANADFTSLIAVSDAEPNDSIETAQLITGFGTGTTDDPQASISGSFLPNAISLTTLPSSPEDNGDITKAYATGIATDQGFVTTGFIGDGPYGNSSGDFDVYQVSGVRVGETITVNMAEIVGTLNWYIRIYDSNGLAVADHDEFYGPNFSFKAASAGDHYIVVSDYFSVLTNPSDSSSGNRFSGNNTQGSYTITAALIDTVIPSTPIGPFAEDDGSIPLANIVNLSSGNAVTVSAEIGDGPYGSSGTGTGDFDFYALPGLRAGDMLFAEIPLGFVAFDWVMTLYDSTGNAIYLFDNIVGSNNFEYQIQNDGDYYLMVSGWPNFPSNVNDSSSGNGFGEESLYDLTVGINLDLGSDVSDIDFYAVDLNAGDVVGVSASGSADTVRVFSPSGTLLIGSSQDASGIMPLSSPLPGGGNAVAAYIAPTSGIYTVAIGDPQTVSFGSYTADLSVHRPSFEREGVSGNQILFLDFDGAVFDAQAIFERGNNPATISPLSSFLSNWSLSPSDEDAVIDAIVERFTHTVQTDLALFGNNRLFTVEIRNSRDHADPFGEPNVSRVIIGGTIAELGISTLGIAESIDPGNFEAEETGIVLLDLLSAESSNPNSLNGIPRDPSASLIDLIGVAVGNIAAHEAGHFLANFHTDQFNVNANIMDQGGNLANTLGLGVDGVFGTADDVDVHFIADTFVSNEGFSGTEDTLNFTAFGLSTDNTPPTISAISNQTVPNGQTITIAFDVNDTQSPADTLAIDLFSSDETLVPLSGLIVSGSGTARTLELTAANAIIGSATITVAVSDGVFITQETFDVEVTNQAPTISSFSDLEIKEGRTATINFTIDDVDNALSDLSLTASTSNGTVIPASNLSFSGSGPTQQLSITATSNTGTSTITVTVSDGVDQVEASFVVTVTQDNGGGGGGGSTSMFFALILALLGLYRRFGLSSEKS